MQLSAASRQAAGNQQLNIVYMPPLLAGCQLLHSGVALVCTPLESCMVAVLVMIRLAV
jgi:hypothetical protein